MARPLWKRSVPFHNDEDRDCPADLPPWRAREITKPPWKARNLHDRQEMIYWVIQQLEKQEILYGTTREQRAALRKRFHLTRRSLPPEPPQQKHKADDVANSALNDAVHTVPFIRKLWRDKYKGHKNRLRNDGASAEEIAAYLFDVNIAHVISRSRKPSGGPRGKRKPKIALPAGTRKIARSN
jgi:hypothetical protein